MGYIGIMEKKMDTTIQGSWVKDFCLGAWGLGPRIWGLRMFGAACSDRDDMVKASKSLLRYACIGLER